MRHWLWGVCCLLTCAVTAQAQDTTNFATIGEVVRLDPAFDKLVAKDARLELVASGFGWAEGPVWISADVAKKNGWKSDKGAGFLLFSDIPPNSVMKWEYGVGISLFLKPAGFTGPLGYGNEPGCNGLMLDREGLLISCEHGDRRLSVLTRAGGKRTLVDNYQGKRLNSPNDACVHSNGDIYFTDPPYGLPRGWDDPARELDFCGVYRLHLNGDGTHELTLVTDQMTRPNGIALSPDEKTLYVAQSDGDAPIWNKFPVKEDGSTGPGTLFADSKKLMQSGLKGAPDGLKVDQQGNVWATGPGGVHVYSPEGKLLGRIDPHEATANCGWGDDGSTLYLTSDMYLCRIKTLSKGAGWK